MSNFYEKYWENKDGHLSDFELKWPKLKKFIPQKNEVVIVDFGCGNGKILSEIKKENPQAKLIGLDVSETALKQAKKQVPEAKFYKIIDGEKFPVDDKTVDFVFTSEVIEHVYDTENALSEISRILKPGGKLLLTTPYHGFIKNLLITLFAFNTHFNPQGAHIRFFTKKNLFNLLREKSLKVLKYGFYGRFWPLSHSIYLIAEKPKPS